VWGRLQDNPGAAGHPTQATVTRNLSKNTE
jgi:hypothetical protein